MVRSVETEGEQDPYRYQALPLQAPAQGAREDSGDRGAGRHRGRQAGQSVDMHRYVRPVSDMTPQEVQRRGDAAGALLRELARRVCEE